MLHCAATARSLWELQAKANAESASKKIKPPWVMCWPLTICGLTVMANVAWPVLTSTISMRPWLASSSAHIASAQARARSSGDSVALTFTLASPRPHRTCCNKPLGLSLHWVSHDAKPPWCQRSLRASNPDEKSQEKTAMSASEKMSASKQSDAAPVTVEARCVRL